MRHARADYNRIQDPANKIPELEPVFLLRGQDKHAARVVRFWADLMDEDNADHELIQRARDHAALMDTWPVKKSPDMSVNSPESSIDKPSQWVVFWKHKDGSHKGNGEPISKLSAESVVEWANTNYPNTSHWMVEATDTTQAADAKRMRWLLKGNGYFMEEEMLCGHDPSESEQNACRKEIDKAMEEQDKSEG